MHIPVLLEEVIKYLDPDPGENFIDCTIGSGGHTLTILEKNGPDGKILGIDQDPEQIENCKLKIANFEKRAVLVCDNFVNLKNIVEKYEFGPVHGILLDLGMSSWHLEESGRGFSFKKDEPLDMRLKLNCLSFGGHFRRDLSRRMRDGEPLRNAQCSERSEEGDLLKQLTAERIVNDWPEAEIERILKEYGEERFSKDIAKKITEERKYQPIKTTFHLVEIIKKSVPGWYRSGKIHCATRAFQALRIAVNNELENLKTVLPRAAQILTRGGRLVVISFHSLEDRIAKNFFRQASLEGKIETLTKKPIRPSRREVLNNPRARSAKLRAGVKL